MMILKTFPYIRCFLFILLIGGAFSAQSATLGELYNGAPRPPADIDTALSWVKDGQIVQAEFLEFSSALANERAAIAELNGGEAPNEYVSVPETIEDNPAVQAAVRGYADYLANKQGEKAPQATLDKRKLWLQRAYGQQQMKISKKMTPCPGPCADASLQAANQPLIRQRNRILMLELRSWNALFDDWKKIRQRVVTAADTLIKASDNGALASSKDGRALIASYRASMVDEVALLLSITKLCVLRAQAIAKGLDGSEPDAISGATKKADK